MRKQRRSTAPRQDIYTTITDRILAALEAGRVPWQKPWDARQGRPRNLISGKAYRGVNLLLLANEGGSPFWLTYRQASQLGGYVKKGERGQFHDAELSVARFVGAVADMYVFKIWNRDEVHGFSFLTRPAADISRRQHPHASHAAQLPCLGRRSSRNRSETRDTSDQRTTLRRGGGLA